MTSFLDRTKRLVSALAILGLIVAPLPRQNVPSAYAEGTVSNGKVDFGSNTGGAKTTMTITFKVSAAVEASSNIHLGFNLQPGDGMSFKDASILPSGGTAGLAPGQVFTNFGRTEALVSASQAISAGATVVIPFQNVVIPNGSGDLEVSIEKNGQNSNGRPGDPSSRISFGVGGDIAEFTVTDNSNTAIQGATAELHSFDGSVGARGVTGSDGKVTLKGSATNFTGKQLVAEVRPPDNRPDLQRPEPKNVTYTGTKLSQSFTMTKGTIQFTGTVALPDGTKACNAMVNGFGPNKWFAAQTNNKGVFSTFLGEGTYRVMIFRMPFGPGCQQQGQQGPPPPQGQQPQDNGPKWVYTGAPYLLTLKTGITKVTRDFTVTKANSTLKFGLKAPSGVNLAQVGGFVEVKGSGTNRVGDGIRGSSTSMSFAVAPDSYNIRFFMPQGQGKILRFKDKSKVTGVAVADGQTVDLGELELTDEAAAGAKLEVETVDQDGNPVANMAVGAFSGGPGGPGEEHEPGGGPSFGISQLVGGKAIATLTVPGDTDINYMALDGNNMKPQGAGPEGGAPPGGGQGPGGEKKFSVMAAGDSYVPGSGPKRVHTISGQTVKGKFTMNIAKSKARVKVVDANGNLMTSLFGFIPVINKSGGGVGGGSPISQGQAEIPLGNGTYIFTVGLPPEQGKFPTDAVEKTFNNSTENITITVADANSDITVNLKDKNGNLITGVDAEAALTAGGLFMPLHISGDGTGTARVYAKADGTKWSVGGIRTFDESGYSFKVNNASATIKAGKSETLTVTGVELNATLTGKVKKKDGTALSGISVDFDNVKKSDAGFIDPAFDFNNRIIRSAVTSSDGSYSLKVAEGSGSVSASAPVEKGLIPTESPKVEAKANQTVTVPDIIMGANDATIEIVAKDENGNPLKQAKVVGFTPDGAISTAKTDDNGKGKLPVTSGETWKIRTSKDDPDNNDYRQSTITAVTLPAGTTTGAATVQAKKFDDTLSNGTTTQFDSSNQTSLSAQSVKGETKFEMNVPGNTFSTSDTSSSDSTGSVSSATLTATLSSTSEAPIRQGQESIGEQFSVSFTNSSGVEQSTLNSTASGSVLVKKDDLDKAGITDPNQVQLVYYDASKNKLSSEGTTAKFERQVNGDFKGTFTTTHASTFEVVAATDSTPPAEATSITATGGKTKVTLAWTNPTDSDFNHLEIYRSENTSSVGDKIKDTATADTSYEDTGLTNGKAYYYTFKSVDATGNVSAGTDQVVGVPTATSAKTLPKTGMIGEGVNGIEGRNGRDGRWLYLLLPMALGIALVLRGRKGLKGING